MAETIDWKKTYGTIFGGGRARYDQDGKFFDIHGKLVEPPEPKKESGLKQEDVYRTQLEQLRQELEIAKADPKSKKAREAHEAEVKKLKDELAQLRQELEAVTAAPKAAEELPTGDGQGSLLDDQIAAQGQIG